ncbi:MAG: LysR family transcriptional regulator [Bdellovibrionales bacterium]
MLPSSSDLTYFLEIAHLGNLTHAANRLGVSQPSLTLAMQRLEQSVGTGLFIRSRQGVKLTKAGDRLLLEARKLMSQWEELRQQTIGSMNEIRGGFVIGCHPSVARYSLPLFLPALLHDHKDLGIELAHDLSRNITHKVLSLDVDIGIVVNPDSHPDLVMKPLTEDVVTLWKSKALKNDDVLVCEPSLLQTQKLKGKFKRAGFDFTRVVESSSLEVIAGMVDCGVGMGILPTRVALAENRELIAVKNAPVLKDEIFLIYRVENRGVRAVQALSQAIQVGFSASRR